MNRDTEEIWKVIVDDLKLENHNFKNPFFVKHTKIKDIVSSLSHIKNNKKEIRILGHITKRENKPNFFKKNNLFLLPSSNNEWVILKGDGYFEPKYLKNSKPKVVNKNKYQLDTLDGDSEGRYIHQICAQGILEDFTEVKNLVFASSGRKRATFKYNAYGNDLKLNGAQIEIDACYESKKDIILIEGKTGEVGSEIIRQLFFPFKYVSNLTKKNVRSIFMVVSNDRESVSLLEYIFEDSMVYESIKLIHSEKYSIK